MEVKMSKNGLFSIITDFIFGAIFRFQQFFRQQKEISKHNCDLVFFFLSISVLGKAGKNNY